MSPVRITVSVSRCSVTIVVRARAAGYSGRYCEITAVSLAARQIVSRSFAYVAIVCLVGVFVLVLVLDILKYVFHIGDFVNKTHGRRLKRSARKTKKPAVAIRFTYVHNVTITASG